MTDVTIAETPTEIPEAPVTTAETPTEIPEAPVTIAEDVEAAPFKEIAQAAESEVNAEAKRKPGRPVGSKNKEPGKPRKPRAKKVAINEEPVEIEPELPRAIPGSLPIPEEAYDLRTAKMLRLLKIQSEQRKEQKRSMYSSWFK